jgi:hypothetical protein
MGMFAADLFAGHAGNQEEALDLKGDLVAGLSHAEEAAKVAEVRQAVKYHPGDAAGVSPRLQGRYWCRIENTVIVVDSSNVRQMTLALRYPARVGSQYETSTPMPNFMLEDLSGSLRAIYLLPLFILIPGYTIAWIFDAFEFRRRTGPFRMALSIPLSIAVCPIVTYLLGRFGSMDAVWAFYWAAALGFAAIQVVSRRRGGRLGFGFTKDLRVFGAVIGVWLVICLASLIDLQTIACITPPARWIIQSALPS